MSANGRKPDREEHVAVPTTRARQGVTGHNVRYVLLASTAAIVTLFAIIYIAFFT